MARDILVLKNGRRITAIATLKMTQPVLEGEDLVPGGACAAALEAEIYGNEPLARGTEVEYYHDNLLLGRFLVEQSRQVSRERYRITAYDKMILFDRDVTEAFNSYLPGWADIALDKLCRSLGLHLSEDFEPPLEKLDPIPATFTGRQLLKWLGQRWGLWFRMDRYGRLLGQWVQDRGDTLDSWRQDGLTLAEYETAPVARVWVRQTTQDVGSVYPDGLEDTANTLIVQGNPIPPDPQKLLEALGGFTYTPFRCGILGEPPEPGRVLTLPDGKKAPVLERVLENSVWTVSAPGNPGLQSTAAWNNLSFSDSQGRLTAVEKTVEGLRATVSDGAGRLAALEVTAQGLSSRVEQTEATSRTHAEASAVTALRSQLTQMADSLEFSVTELRQGLGEKADQSQVDEITEHFRFDMDGLTITNSGSGMGIGISEQRIVFTGGESPTTVIYPNAMETTTLTVQNTLTLGTFSLIPRTNGNLSLRFTDT